MISICIPVYNFDLNMLIHELSQQLELQKVDYEIVVIDDASKPIHKKANEFLCSFKNVVYIELAQNIGRAAIRNLFLNYVHFNRLLFLDCDSQIADNQFIINYLKPELNNNSVVCGGRVYSSRPRKIRHLLRWKYGIYRECKLAAEREKNPWSSFMTNNFLIDREILQKILFDTRLKGYGHEDSLFGYQLKMNSVVVKHVDNQTIHDFNESAGEFLQKTREGIINLHLIDCKLFPNSDFYTMNQLLKTFYLVKKYRMSVLLGIFSYPVLPVLGLLFRLGIVWLWAFDLYKLLFMCMLSIKKSIVSRLV